MNRNPSPATRFSATRQPENHGRPGTYKDRLTRDFLKEMAADFEIHGAATIVRVREEEPAQYLRIAASLVPKEFNVTRPLDGIDDEKLAILAQFAESLLAKPIEAERLND